jgi:hypothetical protein
VKYFFITAICVPILWNNNLTAQQKEFKEVKTAQDVIDNYLTANGGKENLERIKSIKMTGKVDAMGLTLPVSMFMSHRYFCMSAEDSAFGFTIVYDNKNKKGWSRMFGEATDITPEDAAKYSENVESALWTYYLDKDKYGISYELAQNQEIDSINCYAVDFKKHDRFLYTVYFDTVNFNRIKNEKEGNVSLYGDFREVGKSGIYMPYEIVQQGTVKVDRYEFNVKFDKKLLKKPVKKEE